MIIKNMGRNIAIDDCHICYKNLSGAKTMYNAEGDRNFHVVIDDVEQAEALKADGWNVKIREPKPELGQTEFFCSMPVKLKFNDRGPNVYLVTNGKQVILDPESVGCIDSMDIDHVDIDIRPFDWEMQGRSGRTAYASAMRVVQRIDRFANANYDAFLGINVDDDELPM